MYIKSSFISKEKFEQQFFPLREIPFSFFFDCIPTEEELKINPINIYAHDEPNEYFGHHNWVLNNHQKFDLVLTWSEQILKTCPNSQLLLYGESWVNDEKEINKKVKKEFDISFIRGNKLQSYGHQIRHQVFNRENEINIPKRFYASTKEDPEKGWIASKLMAHQPSMFSFIVENTSHHNYFTEKITDCIILKTIPVYWGCTNIEEYYNIDGIVQVYSDDDAINKINSLTPEFYNERLDVIEENWKKAIGYSNYIERIYLEIKKVFEFNNLIK